MEKANGRKRTNNTPETSDQVRSPVEEDGKGSGGVEGQQEEVNGGGRHVALGNFGANTI